jgi:pyruvate,water dikinase
LNYAPVAVRSSATLEDLPDLSFAGQQDTFLNIIGEDALLEAVVDCWSSLWTARAIGYRLRNGINHAEAALAVVVQEMVPSEVSGVLFTANPVTGLLSESVIDAVYGLGEALVSGQVEPDHFVVNHFDGSIVEKKLGEKKLSTRGKVGGGVETIAEIAASKRTLSDNQIHQLVALGQQVHQEFGLPQDIEWAIANGDLKLLQSRPITSLFPVPKVSFDRLEVWISFGAVQGLVGPITPLGRDAIQYVAVGAGGMFGLQLTPGEVDIFASAGERLWAKISDLIRNPIGNRVFGSVFGFIEPSVGQILEPLSADPNLGAGTGKIKSSTLLRLGRFALPVLARMARTFLRPETARAEFNAMIEAHLAEARIAPAADRFEQLENTLAFLHKNITDVFSFLLPRFIAVFGPSMASLNLLNHIAAENRSLGLEVTRGLTNNVTTQMDLALWDTALRIRADAESTHLIRESDPPELAQRYLDGVLTSAAQAAIAQFMDEYGMRGVGEIDLGRLRWREDPTSVMRTLQSYLNIESESSPDVQIRRAEKAAYAAIEQLAAKARQQRGGWLKEKLVRAAARRVRLLIGLRESPKFLVIRLMGIARRALLQVGEKFVEAGTMAQPDDLFFLQLSELQILACKESRDWKALISQRRAAFQREQRRRQIPRVLVSDGRAFYEGLGFDTGGDGIITGSPVSPGTVEGIVRVVLDPTETQLSPGEILVCPGTDPAWTPLFMVAGGLITEVGGMMTHGSVVAREYGIPAVVGVHQATKRLEDGQRIQLDGTTGRITVVS